MTRSESKPISYAASSCSVPTSSSTVFAINQPTKEGFHTFKQCNICNSLTMISPKDRSCRICSNELGYSSNTIKFITCCQCSSKTETSTLSLDHCCRFCAHGLCCLRCVKPKSLRCSWCQIEHYHNIGQQLNRETESADG